MYGTVHLFSRGDGLLRRLARFEAKLKKIAKAKPSNANR
jgi:hypothetical protein